ncbi:MAG: hypothetical protein Phog2KO_34660 [Phototrophicaceae bacterium]
MNRPDPVQHMMAWGVSSATLLLLCYFALTGVLTFPTLASSVFGLLLAGIFTGFTLGGMAGVIIGTVFQHEQERISAKKVENRRLIVLIAVFMMVLIMSRLLIIVAQGIVEHPLTLSLITAVLASLASQHYLLRMETWLKYNKPKRKVKNEDIPEHLVDHHFDRSDDIDEPIKREKRERLS